jgi:hypothetical protein
MKEQMATVAPTYRAASNRMGVVLETMAIMIFIHEHMCRDKV